MFRTIATMKVFLNSSIDRHRSRAKLFIHFALVAVFMSPVPASSHIQQKGAARNTQIQQEVLKVYHEITRASKEGDLATLDLLVADDYVILGPRRELIGDKGGVMALLRAGRITLTYHKDRNLRVSVNGDRAVITGESIQRGTRDGQPYNMRLRVSDVFMKRDGQWQNVMSRVIKILPQL